MSYEEHLQQHEDSEHERAELEREMEANWHPVHGLVFIGMGDERQAVLDLTQFSGSRGYTVTLESSTDSNGASIRYSELRAAVLGSPVRIEVAGNTFSTTVRDVLDASAFGDERAIHCASVDGPHGEGSVDLLLASSLPI